MARAKQSRQIMQMSVAQWEKAFPDEDHCDAYLVAHRWPDGVTCPRCGSDRAYGLKTMKWKWECPDCRHGGAYRFSDITGTIFENTNVDLRAWFRVIHMMLTSKKGVSARQVHRVMGFGSYKTAWYMCHRIRTALQDKDFQKLMGVVEIDETFVGGKDENRHDRNKKGPGGGTGSGKTAVVGAVTRKGNVVARMIANVRANTLEKFVSETVSTEVSVLVTDMWSGYNALGSVYPHFRTPDHSKNQYVSGAIHTNTIEGFWSLLKRSIIGVHHNVSKKYLPLYVAERSFVYNNRHNEDVFGGGHSRMLKRADWQALQAELIEASKPAPRPKIGRDCLRVWRASFHPSPHQASAAMMALEQKPTQNHPEFAWWRLRIKNGVKNASSPQLDDAIETYEAFEIAFAGVVIVGVLFEFFIALSHPAYDSPRGIWGSVIADAFVAIGLVVEVVAGVRIKLCQAELTRRSNARLADAIDGLKKMQQLSGPRMLNPTAFTDALAGKPKAPVTIWYLPEVSDGWSFAFNLYVGLIHCGWDAAAPQQMPNIQTVSPPMHPALAAGGQPSGISIVAPAGEESDGTPFKALFWALAKSTDRGVYGGSNPLPAFAVPPGTLRVIITAKPDPLLELPDWAKASAEVTE